MDLGVVEGVTPVSLYLPPDSMLYFHQQATNVDFSEIDASLASNNNQLPPDIDAVYDGPPVDAMPFYDELDSVELFESPVPVRQEEIAVDPASTSPEKHDQQDMIDELKQLSSSIKEDHATLAKTEERIDAAKVLVKELKTRVDKAIEDDIEILRRTRDRVDVSYRRVYELNEIFESMDSKTRANERCVQCRDSYRSFSVCGPRTDGIGCKRCSSKGRKCTPFNSRGVRKSRMRRCKQCASTKKTTIMCRPSLKGDPCGSCVALGIACRP